MGAWFKVGQHVIASGAGVGTIAEVGTKHPAGAPERERYYRVNFGPKKCYSCGSVLADRLEWVRAMHITLTAGERRKASVRG